EIGIEQLRVVVDTLDAGAGDDFAAAVVERTRGQDVHGRADAAAGHVGAAGLVHGDAVDRLGGELGEVEAARTGTHAAALTAAAEAVGTRDLAAVEGDEVVTRAKATRGDLGAFAVAALDRDAGDALQRLGQVGVRELADVLGADRVDHAGRVALDVHRVVKAAPQARDLHGVQLRGFLRECGIDDDHAADDGEHRPRAELLQLVVHCLVLSTGN